MKIPYVVLVTGGRDYNDREAVFSELNALNEIRKITHVMEGGATGADRSAFNWAWERGVQPVTLQPNWDHYGKGAGPNRNEAMAMLKPNICLAFPGGRGTELMVEFATEYGVPVTKCPR